MQIVERYATKNATDDDIRSLEQKIGFPLPQDYRQFLLQYNGGVPKPERFAFRIPSGEQVSLVRVFFSLDENDPYYNLLRKLSVNEGYIPESCLPIGEDPFGNLILLELSKSHQGNVYFWDHESEGGDDLRDNMALIAGNFTEFTRLLLPF
jgi:cell wall assembly regulator SMI1